tara:strand:+ start:390 stop:743 length:354 start_codon:yes stop_codon:yes gene_type:complete
VGIESAGVGHNINRSAADSALLQACCGAPINHLSPSTQSNKTHSARLQPLRQSFNSLKALMELFTGDLVGSGCCSSHEVSHAKAMLLDCVERITINADDPCGQCRWPKAVAGSGITD